MSPRTGSFSSRHPPSVRQRGKRSASRKVSTQHTHGAGREAQGEHGWDGGVQPVGLRFSGSVNPRQSVFSKQTLKKYSFPYVLRTVSTEKGALLWMSRAPGPSPENQADG